jgi:serine/threonine protein kinase
VNGEREVAILHSLRHPRILTLMGVCRDLNPSEGTMGLIFELMENGSLFDLLHRSAEDTISHRPRDLITKLKVCLDIADGMRFLHNSKILHRDLKSANVLIDRDWRCKIADFGLSTFLDSTMSQTAGLMSTPAWIDPEIDDVVKHSEASDIYSFGVIVWEVFSDEIPWKGLPMTTILSVVKSQRLPIRETFPTAVKGLLASCFTISAERPSFSSAFDLLYQLASTSAHQNQQQRPISCEEVREIVNEGVARVEGAMGDMVMVLTSSGGSDSS